MISTKPNNYDLPTSNTLNSKRFPLIIAGPCSAESATQTIETALEISKIPEVAYFRAGVWKPRTRPNNFEGVGEDGLIWLKKIADETHLTPLLEVATITHIEMALKYGLDHFWLGARTTANPFLVQEVADYLSKVEKDVTIFIKNPICPDLNLWIGAIERIQQAGIKNIIGIHRGCSSYAKSLYRNDPNWKMAVDLKLIMPEIPVLCDPSHIAGDSKYIELLSQYAIDLGLDGLMIETHLTPEKALSDSKQQITPSELKKIINNLKFKNLKNKSSCEDLSTLRNKIDLLDNSILDTIYQRMEVVRQIKMYKEKHDIPFLQVNRWQQMMKDRLSYSNENQIDKNFCQDLFKLIHNESLRSQVSQYPKQ